MNGVVQRPGYEASCRSCFGGGRVLILDTESSDAIPCYVIADRDGCPVCEGRAVRGARRAFRQASALRRDILAGSQFGLAHRSEG